MAEALTTIDALVAAVWRSYVAANERILQSRRNVEAGAQVAAEPGDSMAWANRFIVNNEAGNPPSAIPLALFHAPVFYYLSDLRFELPCYAIIRARFFGKRNFGAAMLHASPPTRWQRLFYVCHAYRLIIDASVDKVATRFVAVTNEEFIRQVEDRTEGVLPSLDWKFVLTEEQSGQLRAVSAMVAKPFYWRWIWRRLREKLSIRQ